MQSLRDTYAIAAREPILDILDRQRFLVVLGDPGSGKTSLLKYTVLRWANEDHGPLPLWIDLKEYARHPDGMLQYLESEECFGLEARPVNEHLRAGKPTRRS